MTAGARWAPNGRQIMFESNRDGDFELYVMNSDCIRQRNLTPKDLDDDEIEWSSGAPSWSTAGRQIYFVSSRPATGLDFELSS